MSSYKRGKKSPNMGKNYSYPIVITLLTTTREPPSRELNATVYYRPL